jgi:hypothetical protein
MQFRIESTDHDNPSPAKTPEELESRLKAKLQHWIETTPQTGDTEVEAAQAKMDKTRTAGIGKPVEAAEMLKGDVDAWKAAIKKNSANLNDEHAEVVELVQSAIVGAVAQVKALGKRCRVSLVGHADPLDPDASTRARPRLRIETHVDLAEH